MMLGSEEMHDKITASIEHHFTTAPATGLAGWVHCTVMDWSAAILSSIGLIGTLSSTKLFLYCMPGALPMTHPALRSQCNGSTAAYAQGLSGFACPSISDTTSDTVLTLEGHHQHHYLGT